MALARYSADTAALADVLYLRAMALAGPDHLDQRLQAVAELLALPDVPRVDGQPRPAAARPDAASPWAWVPDATAELASRPSRRHEQRPPLRTQLDWSRAARAAAGRPAARGRRAEPGHLRPACPDVVGRPAVHPRDPALGGGVPRRPGPHGSGGSHRRTRPSWPRIAESGGPRTRASSRWPCSRPARRPRPTPCCAGFPRRRRTTGGCTRAAGRCWPRPASARPRRCPGCVPSCCPTAG